MSMSLSSVPSVLFPDLPLLHHHHHHHQYQQQFIIIVPFALSLTWWCRQAGSRGFIRSRYNSHIHSCHAPPLFVCLRPPSIVLHRKWGASSSPPTTILLLPIIIFIVMTINIRLRSGHTPKHCMLIRPQSPSLSKYPCLLVGSYTSNSLNSSTHPIHSFINSNRV